MDREEHIRLLAKFDLETRYSEDTSISPIHIARREFISLLHDFETRTCENCEYYGAEHEHIIHPNYRTCINVDSFTYMQEPHFKDGCSKFKRKEK